MVIDFFKNLVRYRVEGVRSKANAKIYGAKARAQSKAASKFNSAVDAPLNKAKAKAKGAAKKGGDKAKAKAKPDKQKAEKKGGGFFSKKKDDKPAAAAQAPRRAPSAPAAHAEIDPGMHTQAIDISGLVDERAQDVVGWVVCLNGVLRGKDFRLVTGKNVMGTAADCDVVLTDPYLSSSHAVIRHEDGRFMLIDLDSTNGTFCNDRRVSKTELIDNDKIRLGRTEMKFKSLF